MEPIKTFTARIVPLPMNDIDTDQIIPARFLKVTDKQGLGQACFSDWRYNADGSPKIEKPVCSNRPHVLILYRSPHSHTGYGPLPCTRSRY